MKDYPLFDRYPFLKELICIFRYEVQQSQRPANEVVLNDEDVMRLLKISKRKLNYMKAARAIPFCQPQSRSSCYYFLSDILSWLKKNKVEAIGSYLVT
jgi:hypothetical protein